MRALDVLETTLAAAEAEAHSLRSVYEKLIIRLRKSPLTCTVRTSSGDEVKVTLTASGDYVVAKAHGASWVGTRKFTIVSGKIGDYIDTGLSRFQSVPKSAADLARVLAGVAAGVFDPRIVDGSTHAAAEAESHLSDVQAHAVIQSFPKKIGTLCFDHETDRSVLRVWRCEGTEPEIPNQNTFMFFTGSDNSGDLCLDMYQRGKFVHRLGKNFRSKRDVVEAVVKAVLLHGTGLRGHKAQAAAELELPDERKFETLLMRARFKSVGHSKGIFGPNGQDDRLTVETGGGNGNLVFVRFAGAIVYDQPLDEVVRGRQREFLTLLQKLMKLDDVFDVETERIKQVLHQSRDSLVTALQHAGVPSYIRSVVVNEAWMLDDGSGRIYE